MNVRGAVGDAAQFEQSVEDPVLELDLTHATTELTVLPVHHIGDGQKIGHGTGPLVDVQPGADVWPNLEAGQRAPAQGATGEQCHGDQHSARASYHHVVHEAGECDGERGQHVKIQHAAPHAKQQAVEQQILELGSLRVLGLGRV